MIINKKELWIGLTNLPILVSALTSALLIRKYEAEKGKKWFLEFFMIACSAMLGTVAHCLKFTERADNILWIILYFLLYAVVWMFFRLMYGALRGNVPGKYWLIAAAVCYAASCVIKVLINRGDIYVFVAYSIPVAAILIFECVKQGSKASGERLVMILLGLAVSSQALKVVFGSGAVVTAHLLVFAAMIALYKVARKQISRNCR